MSLSLKRIVTYIYILIIFFSSTSCINRVAGGIEVVEITEQSTITGILIQTRTYDNCFSSSASEEHLSLTQIAGTDIEGSFGASISFEFGIPILVKEKLKAAINGHFSYKAKTVLESLESVIFTVPAGVKQEYVVEWQETRREGQIEYTEDTKTKTTKYSYLIGLEKVHSTRKDLPCPSVGAPVVQTSIPESVHPFNLKYEEMRQEIEEVLEVEFEGEVNPETDLGVYQAISESKGVGILLLVREGNVVGYFFIIIGSRDTFDIDEQVSIFSDVIRMTSQYIDIDPITWLRENFPDQEGKRVENIFATEFGQEIIMGHGFGDRTYIFYMLDNQLVSNK